VFLATASVEGDVIGQCSGIKTRIARFKSGRPESARNFRTCVQRPGKYLSTSWCRLLDAARIQTSLALKAGCPLGEELRQRSPSLFCKWMRVPERILVSRHFYRFPTSTK